MSVVLQVHAPAVAAPRPLGPPGVPWSTWWPAGGTRGMPRWALAGVALAMVLAMGGGVATAVTHPAPAKPPAVACSPTGPTALTAEPRAHATTIVAVGRALGVPDRGLTVALATALQESTLRNQPRGAPAAAGLVHQRPAQGWGAWAQVTHPVYAAKTFYRRLLKVPGWDRMPVTVAAQTVQHSAFPEAYAKWERLAASLVSGTTCSTTK